MKSIVMKDSVGKWYKDKAKDLNVIPPAEAWRNIENQLEDWPKHWYQANYNEVDSGQEKNSWDTISKQLILRRNIKIGKRNFIIRTATLIIGLALIPVWLSDTSNIIDRVTDSSLGYIAQSNKKKTNDDRKVNTANHTLVRSLEDAFDPNTAILEPTTAIASALNIQNSATVSQETYQLASNFASSNERFNTIVAKPIHRLSSLKVALLEEKGRTIKNLTLRATNEIRYVEPTEVAQIRPRQGKWSLGPVAIFGQSTLRNPLSIREDVTTKKTFNTTLGISASRSFKKNRLTAELLFNDTKSQKTQFISEELNTSLRYITSTLQYERSIPVLSSLTKLAPELNFGVGIFGSVATSVSVTSNQENSFYTGLAYRNFDFGGVLTAGTSVHLLERWKLGIHARFQPGVINLFEGQTKIPRDLFRTQSFATGIQTKLSFQF